jgi:predicted metal-dependent hydrolase
MTTYFEMSGLVFEVRRGQRRKSLCLTVDRSGDLVVHAPLSTLDSELQRWAASKLIWIHKKLAQKSAMLKDLHLPEFVSGESIFYLGRSYRLRIVDTAVTPVRFDSEWFELECHAAATAAAHFEKWYLERGTTWLRARSAELERLSGQAASGVIVKDLGFRWGSCGKNRMLYFNWRLLQLPVELIDYVILHEQVHLIHYSHTKEYWRSLDSVLPDWSTRKDKLEREWAWFTRFASTANRRTLNNFQPLV